jgi:hypothetical protein
MTMSLQAGQIPNYLVAAPTPPAAARDLTRLEILQDRLQSLIQGLGVAGERLNKVADVTLGFPPPAPPTKEGGGAIPVADAKVQRLSQQLDDAGVLLNRVFNQIERLETL